MCHYNDTDLETNMWIPDSNPFISFVSVYEIIILLKLSETQPCLHEKQRKYPAHFPLHTKTQGRRWISCQVHGAGVKAPGYRTEHSLGSWGGVLNPLSTWGSQTTEHSHQRSAVLFLKIFSKSQSQAVQTIESLFKCLPVLDLKEARNFGFWKEIVSPQNVFLSVVH